MSETVLIVMTSGPDTPRRCATPFFMASLAAAMDYEVFMFFSVDGILLLRRGLADDLYAKPGGKSVGAFMREAQRAGVHFLACTSSTDLHDIEPADLIDGVTMAGGARMWEIAEDAKVVLSY